MDAQPLSDTPLLIVFYSYEDYEYARNVWSWDSSKNPTRFLSTDELVILQKFQQTDNTSSNNDSNSGTISTASSATTSYLTYCCIHLTSGLTGHEPHAELHEDIPGIDLK